MDICIVAAFIVGVIACWVLRSWAHRRTHALRVRALTVMVERGGPLTASDFDLVLCGSWRELVWFLEEAGERDPPFRDADGYAEDGAETG